MSSLADLPELVGFFSYSRDDDEDSKGALSALRERIQRELRGQLGRSFKSFRLWQDKEAIAPGKLWQDEIKTAVGQSVFFIPIITPTVVKSPFCKFELDSFLAREQALGRTDLVFPLLYIRVPSLEDGGQRHNDPVISIIAKRQYVDWREFRHLEVEATKVKEAIERFCTKIVEALYVPYSTSEELEAKLRAEEEKRREREAEEARERERLAQDAEEKPRADDERRKREAAEQERRVAEERRRKDAESKESAKEGERRTVAELATRRRTEEEGRRKRWSPTRHSLLIAGAGGIVALVVVWAGLYQMGLPVWLPWTAGPVQPDPAAEARRKADEEAALKKKMEEAAVKKKAEEEAAAKKKAGEEDARRRAEEDARRDPALAVVPGSGQSFRNHLASGEPCPICPDMVVVPAGKFTMGSPNSELGHSDDESPQHEVTIAKPLAVGRFAVTFDEWDACVADGGCNGHMPSDQGWGRARRPVINVSWADAKAYAAWLSRKTGKIHRLLTEAEREYVTRAGTTTPFWWGGSISSRQANYNGRYSYGGGSAGEFRAKTLPVDSFLPNPWGLYQVHGNVWEWVEDCWNNSYQGAPTDGSAWTSENCSHRVLRGGSWGRFPPILRSADRVEGFADYRVDSFGFRVARTLSP